MNDCCKHAKWWPHNWLCLKGLYIFFIVLFYLTLVFALIQDYQIFTYPLLTGKAMWGEALRATISNLFIAIALLTVAKMLKALRKIKKAVAPCCCEKGAKEEKASKKEEKSK